MHTVIQALQGHAGAEEEATGLAGKRKHPRPVGEVPGAGGQRDDGVSHHGLQKVLSHSDIFKLKKGYL